MRARMTAMGMRRRVAVLISAVLVGSILQASTTSATAADNEPLIPASEKPLSGHSVTPRPRLDDGAPRTPKARPRHAWAKPGSATVSLQPGTKSKAVRAGSLPITLITPKTAQHTPLTKAGKTSHTPLKGSATLRILDQKTALRAGVNGLLFSLKQRPDATGNTVGISLDYSAFAQAYGGAYASRLKLVQLPACAATRPQDAKCSKATPLASHNDAAAKTLTATALTVPAKDSAAPVLLAATAGTSSDQGDYKATQLSPSSAWQTNLNTGDFTWSYDMPVPDVPGAFKPQVGLAYSSGGIDGRTSNSNNQSSWAGDGFDLWPGFIERSYKPCSDDGVTNADGAKPGDLCWAYDNATLSFNGHSGELIATGTNSFRLKGDDGTRVDRIYGKTGDDRDNGDNDQEYWRVTTTDGTQYYFGYNKLPDWSTGDETTDSTWTTPVFGDDTDDKCHKDTFADSWCQQAWRWNLDYAVDTHGNAIAYYYTKETNYYARNLKAADETVYDRGGYLDRIEYGLKSSAMYSAKPLAKVDFTSAERCLPETGVTCDASTIGDKSFYWYDTPWDLNCKSGADCYNGNPSFWTRKRLTDVTTEVRQSDGTYAPVDTWKLDHRWGKSDIDYQLLLDSLQHTGRSASPEITLPKVTFAYDQRTNRLKIDGDNTAPFIKERLSGISDETGGDVTVDYSTAACDASDLPTPQTNTTRCFPVYFTKEGAKDPTLQWFNKYVVDSVTQTDRTKSSPEMVTRYRYLDGAAWHYDDDDGLTKEKYKTWSTWRGYAHVRVQAGGQEPVGMKSQADHYFLRGMDGDKAAPTGGTKSVTVSDDSGGTITDHNSVAGFEYKTEQYSGPDGKILNKTVNTPWHHETGKRVRSWGTTTANLTATASTRTWTSLDDGAGSTWRTTYQTHSFEDTAGRVTQTDDFGDESTAKDNQCTRTTYADNTTSWILDAPSRVETVAVKCADVPDRSKDVLADIRTAYDKNDYGAAPTKGDATRTATLKSHDGKTATYLETETAFDGYGRPTTATDITATVTATETTSPARTTRKDGRTTTTVYTPSTGFPTTSTVTTPPATVGDATTAQTTTTTYDTVRSRPISVVDTNGKRTDTTYDALGRTLKVWKPNRSKASNDTPNYEFSYTIADGKPTAVGTTTLFGTGRRTSYTLYDGFLRQRQTQAPGPDGGRLIGDAFYDERGLTSKAFAPYYNTSAPSPDLLALDDALAVETQTWNTYDGLGRVTKSQQIAGNGDNGKVLSTTTTAYGGDRVTVTPPKGATPTTTVADARGRTTQLWQYHGTTPTGAPDKTLYEYNPAGKLTKLTDPAGNNWTYTYDQRGNQTVAIDPDKGETDSYYTDRNQLDHTVDADKNKITHVYDGLGRETETRQGDASGALLTKHVWDPTGYKGQLASATRYIGGASGSAYTTTYSLYDSLYRPHRTTVTIPAAEGDLAGSYQSNIQYNVDGTVQSTSYPAAGSLTAETISPTYDDALRVKTLSGSGGATYLTNTVYSYTGKPLQYTYQAAGAKKTDVTNTYDWGTQRLHNSSVNREDIAGTDKSATYSYDEAGNITSIGDVSRDGTDNQCFTYDYVGRLTEAWAQNTPACATTPTASVLGGPAPYWQSYTYDLSGNRRTETQHDISGDTTKDINRTYSYPTSGSKRPHALTQVDTTGPNGISQDTYTYDDAGNTATRTINGDQQTLTWDAEGHLSQVTKPDGNGGTKTTSYLYDADGNRLITHTDADATLYLGNTQITLAKGSTAKKATRYYDLGGGNQAIRTSDNRLSFLLGDHHGTSELAINATDLTLQQRRSTPFGASRGKAPANWPGDKGFVGGTQDNTTGFTHLGARDYDPSTGHFLSADPLLDPSNPQQLNAYAYANGSPVTNSDPSGLITYDKAAYPDSSGHCTGGWNACGAGNHGLNTGGRSTGNGSGRSYTVGKDGQPVFNGLRIPTMKELVALNPQLDPRHATYFEYFSAFAKSKCDSLGNKEFCAAAKRAGFLWGEENDPWGVKATIHCITGRGDCGEALVEDVITLATLDWGSFARGLLVRGATKAAVKEAGESAVLSMLRGACSFSPSTPVLLKNGRTKPIGKVRPGDKVAVADPQTGKRNGARRVTAQLVHHDNDLVDVTVRAVNGGNATLHTTANHPFWDDTDHAWVPAGSLRTGHSLNTAADKHVQVVGVENEPGEADMYNLTVEHMHTYYVLAGATPVLVHNAGCPTTTFYHGANVQSLVDILNNGLDASKAAANYTDGPGGFFVATHYGDAEYFAMRSGSSRGIIKVTISDDAMVQLREAGAVTRSIPEGPKSMRFEGEEFHIPTSAFGLFNQLRASGGINVSP
ncbi:polymorphic toxin-type HINT domain-containing protein [Streptomyces sp. NPDC008240]|uniref:polymorphic toxin-type HINT domain-containing protein n=1 Tax=Streptomyces sp. NPDC008240 TaxID=3364822 RepID=UPI0036F06DA1